MKRYFRNLDIECWHHVGRARSVGPSVCLFKLVPESCAPLLQAIDELEAAGSPAQRKLTFKQCGRPNECSILRLILSKEISDFHQIRISVESNVATIEATSHGLQQLRESIVLWRDGGEDFCLSPPPQRNSRDNLGKQGVASLELWFWGPYYAGP